MNYYKLLEISPGASFEVINIAYNVACEKYREDDEKINLLKVAYVTLSNKTTREQYDMLLPHIEYKEEEAAIEKLKEEIDERKKQAEMKLQFERMAQNAKIHAEQKKNVNYYELLNVAPTASVELITAAYSVAREKYFYDPEKMQQLLMAYETLTDETIRKEYDMIYLHTETRAAKVPIYKKQQPQQKNAEETAKSRGEQERMRNEEFRKRYIQQERRAKQEIFYEKKQLDEQRAARMAEGLKQFREKEEQERQQLKLTEEERIIKVKRREEQARRWKEQGLCEYCGGKLSLFSRKCKSCKR